MYTMVLWYEGQQHVLVGSTPEDLQDKYEQLLEDLGIK